MMITSEQGRRRNAEGRLVAGPPSLSATRRAEAERRRLSKEWLQFRQTYLYSQLDLAYALGCSKRTIAKVEKALCVPLPRFRRRFNNLKQQEETMAADRP
jgi:DNA-binding XRE family transcriptional regulator